MAINALLSPLMQPSDQVSKLTTAAQRPAQEKIGSLVFAFPNTFKPHDKQDAS